MSISFMMSALHIFPGRRQPSIVCTTKLNYRVRNGNGWDQLIINTNYLKALCTLKTEQKNHTLDK